jgi:predicted phage gp36 major capsid-like protein
VEDVRIAKLESQIEELEKPLRDEINNFKRENKQLLVELERT